MNVTSLSDRYFRERPALDNALEKWKERLEQSAHRVDHSAVVSGRVKSHRSVVGKAYREPGNVRPWEKFGDLVALKAIFPTARGVAEFTAWLDAQKQWNPKLDAKEGSPKELKYKSNQFDLVADDITDSGGNPLRIEVQVRTAAADAWYVVDHRLQYKGPVELPSDLQRKLYRLIVLAELFDEEVEAVLARQVELPEYAAARLYEELVQLSDELFDGHVRTSRPEGLLELLLGAYRDVELETVTSDVRRFAETKSDELSTIINRHLHGSMEFIEERDWIYYEPEVLLIAERAVRKPALLTATVADSDFEGLIEPMIDTFSSLR